MDSALALARTDTLHTGEASGQRGKALARRRDAVLDEGYSSDPGPPEKTTVTSNHGGNGDAAAKKKIGRPSRRYRARGGRGKGLRRAHAHQE